MVVLAKIYREVSTELAKTRAEAILLSQDQMLVRKHMVPSSAPSGFKTPALAPAPNGYAIYVRLRLPGADKDRPQQRVSSAAPPMRWDPATMRLLLDRTTLDLSWQLLNQAGEVISITVCCGSEQVFDEVDRVLSLIATFLLG